MSRKKIHLVTWAVYCLIISTVACSPRRATEQDIIGIWVLHQGAISIDQSIGCSYLEFFGGGQFEAHNIPEKLLIQPGAKTPPTATINSKGSWRLVISNDRFDTPTIHLVFASIPSNPYGFETDLTMPLTFTKSANFLYLNFEDSSIYFTKTDKSECVEQ